MGNAFLVFSVCFLACLAIRAVYELQKETGRIDPENKIVFAGILAAMIILWLSWFGLPESDPFPMGLPEAIRRTGLLVFVIGTILAIGALIQLRGVENIQRLVTGGLFKRIRHPMYLGFICWFLGWSVAHDAGASLLLGLVGTASVVWWRHLEERRLEAQFGSAYQQYRRATWF